MISYLEGRVLKVNESSIILVTEAGIGFEVSVPESVFREVTSIGQELFLYTYMSVSENNIGLYGFLEDNELDFFKLLISVSGIGPKGALGILSSMTIEDLVFAISADDVKTISKAPGIGKKTAEKLIVELRDKVAKVNTNHTLDSFVSDTDISMEGFSDMKAEAVEALKVLGVNATEALKRVNSISIDASDTVETIINKALLAG